MESPDPESVVLPVHFPPEICYTAPVDPWSHTSVSSFPRAFLFLRLPYPDSAKSPAHQSDILRFSPYGTASAHRSRSHKRTLKSSLPDRRSSYIESPEYPHFPIPAALKKDPVPVQIPLTVYNQPLQAAYHAIPLPVHHTYPVPLRNNSAPGMHNHPASSHRYSLLPVPAKFWKYNHQKYYSATAPAPELHLAILCCDIANTQFDEALPMSCRCLHIPAPPESDASDP